MRSLYREILGASWDELHPAVRRMHLNESPLTRLAGRFTLTIKLHRRVAILLAAFGVRLRPSRDISMRLILIRRGDTEIWRRYFGRHKVETIQSASGGNLLLERMGPTELRFGLDVREGALTYRFDSTNIGIWPLSIRLPNSLAPRGSATESVDVDGVRVDVTMEWPIAGVTFRYFGVVRTVEATR